MLGASLDIAAYIDRFKAELDKLDQAQIKKWADLVYEAYENGKFVYIFGNGGSGCSSGCR